MRETWYVLEDGTAVHPSEVAPNKDGRLAHKSGLVAMRPDGETPLSRGVDVDEEADAADGEEPAHETETEDETETEEEAVSETEANEPAPTETTEAKPEPKAKPRAKKPGYKTRKAR